MALATGLLQGGSTVKMVETKKRERVNNIEALAQKLSILKNNLEWTERLDLTINIKVIFKKIFNCQTNIFKPEEGENGDALANIDDFEREKHFQNIAQEGARRGVIKAKRAGLPLLRPDGIFCLYRIYSFSNF